MVAPRAAKLELLLAGAVAVALGACAVRVPTTTAELRIVPAAPGPAVAAPPVFRIGPGDLLELSYCRKYDGIDEEYLLDVGDVISVRIEDHPELSSEAAVVRPDGRITVPLVGDVLVRGETLATTTERLRVTLERRMRSPEVNLTVVKPRVKLDEFFETLVASGGVARTMLVRPDGRLSFPLLGEVLVAGRTVAQVERELGDGLRRVLRYVDVTVNVKSSPRQRIAVLGEVQRPGVYALEGPLTPLQAVALAGGFLRTADVDGLVVARDAQAGASSRGVAINSPRDARAAFLEAEDIVFVPLSGIANVNLFVEQYIKQVLPFGVTTGAYYNLNPVTTSGRP